MSSVVPEITWQDFLRPHFGDPVEDMKNGDNKEASAGSPAPASAVAVRHPPYWYRNPIVWFLQTEWQFHLAGLTNPDRKYHHVVSALSPAGAGEVYHVLAHPWATASHDQLKATLAANRGVGPLPLAATHFSERAGRPSFITVAETNGPTSW